jgi:hypothetical protein
MFLGIRNDKVRIRIPLFRSFRIRITLQNCQLGFSWPCLSVYDRTAARLLNHFLRFSKDMFVVKDQLDHFEEKF